MVNRVEKSKPVFRNLSIADLIRYRLPLSGKVSILHRISGLLLFIALPFTFYLFDQSLGSQLTFDALKGFFSHIVVKLIVLLLAWAYLFHFFAGLRFLITDLHLMLDKGPARQSSAVVLIISTVLTIAVGLKLFGVF